jgi:hypothetical protein
MPNFNIEGGAVYMKQIKKYPIKFFVYPSTESFKIMRQALDNFEQAENLPHYQTIYSGIDMDSDENLYYEEG